MLWRGRYATFEPVLMDLALTPLPPEQREDFRSRVVEEFALALAAERNEPVADARRSAETDYERERANEREAPLSGVFVIGDASEGPCGLLWLVARDRPAPETRHILYITIFERFRRQGRALAAMRLVEDLARAAGVDALTLHVFQSNQVARNLYRRLGFSRDSNGLVKWLRPGCEETASG